MRSLIYSYVCLLFIAAGFKARGQSPVVLDSSNLPIVAMKLPFLWPPWDPIPDTPKVTLDMGIIDKGYNVMNHIGDPLNGYAGKIGIEKRGSISQVSWFQQKSYGLETRDSLLNDLDVSLIGMPPEHDWVLYAPFDDESLMRNVLVYQLGREMGYWTPRTKFCEVQFYDWAWNPDYRGVYVMMEKIKRDANRVNISKLDTNDNSGDQLTGGYIFAVDKNIWAQDSGWKSPKDTSVFFSYKYPKGDEITPQQKYYIQQYVDTFETVLQGPNFADPLTGYRKYIEPASFMDFFFFQELTKSVDAFRRSAYLYKNKNSKGGKLVAGPLWDFNSSLYNAKLCTFESDTGWAYPVVCWVNAGFHVPFWWGRFLQDTVYANDLKCRWMQWRTTVFDTAHIFHLIDSMAAYIQQGSVRHFARFQLNTTLQPNVDTLKWWITKRLNWLDANMPGNCYNFAVSETGHPEGSVSVYPNPGKGLFTVALALTTDKRLKVEILDVLGRAVKTLHEGVLTTATSNLTADLGDQPAGVYLVRISGDGLNYTRRIVLEK
jgi:hypothetical protein